MILGLGTALPEHAYQLDDRFEIAEQFFNGTDRERRLLPILYERTGVKRRFSAILNSAEGSLSERQTLYLPRSSRAEYAGPSISDRMECFEQLSGPLALQAVRNAIEQSDIHPEQITHLVTVSCTGFSAPGFDLYLLKEIPLLPSVQRTHVGFMGCHGGLNGLRVARAFAESDPNACVLLCATELCSLHYQYQGGADQIVSNALFADGSMALVGGGQDFQNLKSTSWISKSSASHVVSQSNDMMTWNVRNLGFEMSLSPKLPHLIEEHVRPWLSSWLAEHDLQLEDIKSWAVHPGGPRILSSFQKAMQLPDEALSHSRHVLQNFGNMSSATVFFIIKRMIENQNELPCVSIGFGPGITIEAALFTDK